MPESDPSDGEINDVDEFLREFDDIGYDETLIGLVGEGYDANAPGDQEVADLLGAWRDDVRQTPTNESQLPSAHTVSGRLPPAITGGTLSISENAAALADIAADTTVAGSCVLTTTSLTDDIMPTLQEALGTLEDDSAQAVVLLGNGASAQAVGAAGEAAKSALGAVLASIQAGMQRVEEARAAAQVFYGAVREAAERHSS